MVIFETEDFDKFFSESEDLYMVFLVPLKNVENRRHLEDFLVNKRPLEDFQTKHFWKIFLETWDIYKIFLGTKDL